MTASISRRTAVAILASAVPGMAFATDAEELDPTDIVPRRFSVNRFLGLSENEVYKVNLAVRRGRKILIEGFSPSESKEIIMLAAEDFDQARARLTR